MKKPPGTTRGTGRKRFHVADALLAALAPLDGLQADPDNPNTHPDEQVAAIGRSLDQFGQDQPLVVRRNGTVVKGNGRLAAMRALGWTHAAVVMVGDNEALAMARGLADHSSRRGAVLDEAKLEKLLQAAGAYEGKEVPGFDREFLRSLRDAVRAHLARVRNGGGPQSPTPTEDALSGIRQVVLTYTDERYRKVLAVLEAVMEEEGAESHTDAVLVVLDWWERRHGGTGEGE